MLFKEGGQIVRFLKTCRPPWLADKENFWAYFAQNCLILNCFKAGLHFQSFCSPTKALKVEFISTFRTNERAQHYCAQCDDRFGRRTKRLKVEAGLYVEQKVKIIINNTWDIPFFTFKEQKTVNKLFLKNYLRGTNFCGY